MATYIQIDDQVVNEADGTVSFVISLTAADAAAVTVNYSYANGEAANGSDYTGSFGTLTFNPGETTKTITFTINNDAVIEQFEHFYFTLSSPSANAQLERRYATVVIGPNDGATGAPIASVSDVVLDEKDDYANFVITLDKPATGNVTVNFATAPGSATAGADYASRTGSVVFAAGETAKTVQVSINDDNTSEAAETFKLTLTNAGGSGATVGDSTGIARIGVSDGSTGTPFIKVADATVGEADGYLDLVFSLSQPSTQEVSFYYSYGNWSASNSSDYVASYDTLRFAPGETTKTVRMAILEDVAVETNEHFYVSLQSPVNATIGRPYGVVEIIDNDATTGTPAMSISDVTVDEKAGTATFSVTLDKPSSSKVSVSYATGGGNATSGTDYVADAGAVAFRPGETAKTVTVQINDDATVEGFETFNVTLSSAVNSTIADGVGTGTIGASDAAAGAPFIMAADTVVSEADGTASVVFSLSAPSSQQVSFYYSYGYGTTNGSDFSGGASGYMYFAPGETTKTVTYGIEQDFSVENFEQFFVTLSSATNATIQRPSVVVGIVDDDASTGTPVMSIGDVVVDEAAGTAQVVVMLDKPSAGVVSAAFATGGGNASAASDYIASSGKVSFLPGETAKTISVILNNDATKELAETLNVSLSAPSGATLGDAVGTVQIGASDGSTGTAQVRAADAIAVEGAGYAEVVFTLSQPSSQSLYFYASYGNSTATYNSDYDARSGYIYFAPGQTTTTWKVPLINDSTAESTETFFVTASSVNGGTLERNSITVTIVDDDGSNQILAYGLSDDTYTVDAVTDTIVENANGGYDRVISSVNYTLPTNVEEITGNASANQLTGNAQDNKLYGLAGNDYLRGGAGKDVLDGGTGTDVLEGGDGNDTYYIDNAGDVIIENFSGGVRDYVIIRATYTLDVGLEDLRISAIGSVNATGNTQNNIFYSGLGNNVITGGGGIDAVTYIYAASAVRVDLSITGQQNTGPMGLDTLSGIGRVFGSKYNDVLTGNGYGNAIKGYGGNDTISGGGGGDLLLGLDGNDRINGGSGNDTLNGGAGADRFEFASTLNGATNVDIIEDFNGEQDLLVLDRSFFTQVGAAGNLTAAAFRYGAAAADASDRIIYDQSSGNLFYDPDGTGAQDAILFATVGAGTTIFADDFLIVS